MKEKNNQKISCDVESCIHQNNNKHVCELKEIKVNCSDCETAEVKDDTKCASYEKSED